MFQEKVINFIKTESFAPFYSRFSGGSQLLLLNPNLFGGIKWPLVYFLYKFFVARTNFMKFDDFS